MSEGDIRKKNPYCLHSTEQLKKPNLVAIVNFEYAGLSQLQFVLNVKNRGRPENMKAVRLDNYAPLYKH